MELVVGVLLVPALVVVVARFIVRADDAPVRLPRIVDDSIGMYVLRGITGRPLGRSPDPARAADPLARYRRPSTVLAPRVDSRVSLARWPARVAVATAVGPSLVAAAPSERAWSAIPLPAGIGQTSGGTAVPRAEREPFLARLRDALRPAWLGGAIVVGLLAGGGLALITR